MPGSRRSGILLHPTSLPGGDGIGSLGAEALCFIDFLAAAGQTLWQILPLGPPGCGNSPYSCFSAFAGNPLLIDLPQLVADGELEEAALGRFSAGDRINSPSVAAYKGALLRQAATQFFSTADQLRLNEFRSFCAATFWLDDYALFAALKSHFKGVGWNSWPEALRKRDSLTCSRMSVELASEIAFHRYLQWQFSRQWSRVKGYANQRGILIIGDAPIFVAHDSADVWCNQHIFTLDEGGNPTVVAGVPPDYFSATGQRWGNPLYRWDRLAADNYSWWRARVSNDLSRYDILRIDHFRGFEACWEIPAAEATAVKGRWVEGPGYALFEALRNDLGELPLIAEDLGMITPAVLALRDRCGFPGMKILQFAFDSGADNAYLPHNHVPGSVVYTGTHDNDTTQGWFAGLSHEQQQRICEYLPSTPDTVVIDLIRAAFASVARLAIVPMQDILGLDSTARMNIPGVADNNWGWRLLPGYAEHAPLELLKKFSALYYRNSQQ
jgi:4-alpha-glucanotransferase